MIRPTLRATCCAVVLLAPLPALAEIPDWLSGAWSTSARLTAPDGAQIRIRCSIDAATAEDGDWTGTLGCATVQGRFEGQWQIAIAGDAATGQVVFTGPEAATLEIAGTGSDEALALQSPDGQGVGFRPGAEGALIVAMDRLGPQRLTGELTFEPR